MAGRKNGNPLFFIFLPSILLSWFPPSLAVEENVSEIF
jgi:hypothetical protein